MELIGLLAMMGIGALVDTLVGACSPGRPEYRI